MEDHAAEASLDRRHVLLSELKRSGRIAAPVMAVTISQYMLQVMSVMMVGHSGNKVSLTAVAIASSITNVTGFSLLSGMSGGLETLCGQAYGAEQYHKLATHTYSAIISFFLVCTPISVLWIFMDYILKFLGQDPLVSTLARNYSIWLIPGLFGSAILRPLTRYLQTQGLIHPLVISSFFALCCHIPICWALVFPLKLKYIGAAIAMSLSTWLNLLVPVLFCMYSSACEKTRLHFSARDAISGIGQFFKLAVPAAIMVCLKWWTFELLVLLAGLLPNPTLETSVLAIAMTVSTLHFTIPYGFGTAASIRISNELGAGNPQSAQVVVQTSLLFAVTESVIVSIALFCGRHLLWHAYTKETEVVSYLAALTPLISLSIITDGLQAVIAGVAKGSGQQAMGAIVNLAALYLNGLPISLVLGFLLHFRAKGFWIGLVTGSVVQTSILIFLIIRYTNWSKQAEKARARSMA